VLAKGYHLYYGTPHGAEEWFTGGLGLKRPPHTAPSDFILDQANIDFDKSSLLSEKNANYNSLKNIEDLKHVSILNIIIR